MSTLVKPSPFLFLFGGLIAALAWFALILQYAIHTGSATNFFSYFTVLCNLLIAVGLTGAILSPAYSKARRIFTSASVQTATALYIFIVGLVYNLVLRGIWTPTGWQLVADNLLHVVVPLLYVLYWYFNVPKGALRWKDGLYWIGFPLAYLIYSLVRGPKVGWYPYPFLNIGALGYSKVLLNAGAVLLAFLVTGLLLITIKRSSKKD